MKYWIIFVLLFLLTACKSISEEEAVQITRDYVDSKIRFYVNDSGNSSETSKASIVVTEIVRIPYQLGDVEYDTWQLYLIISSSESGIEKSNKMLFVIDAKSGEILNWGTAQ